jgi:hypothetical protein
MLQLTLRTSTATSEEYEGAAMLNWLRDRKAIKAIDQSAAVLIKFQFDISDVEPNSQAHDQWVLGYVFGAVTGVLQRIGIEPDGDHRLYLVRGYEGVYGEWGHLVLTKSLTMTSDHDFAEAQLVGASEIIAAGPSLPPPFGLGAYLGSLKGTGAESSRDVRTRLRERAMERMTPAAFQGALAKMTGA